MTGEVDAATWLRLLAITRTPTAVEREATSTPVADTSGRTMAKLDRRCRTGRVMCVSKRTQSLLWVIDGRPQLQVDVRFGSPQLPTRNGSFTVARKSRCHVSTIYHTAMPDAMFFSRGQAALLP